MNNEVKAILKEVNELPLKNSAIAISDDERNVQSDSDDSSSEDDKNETESQRNFIINLG